MVSSDAQQFVIVLISGVFRMPLIHVSLFEGRSIEQKRAFAEQVTKVASETLQCSPASVDVIFEDIKASDWATAGQLHSDKPA
ncbi:MAG: hypothetical protein RL539_1440 [Pseudomonadota bacterium]